MLIISAPLNRYSVSYIWHAGEAVVGLHMSYLQDCLVRSYLPVINIITAHKVEKAVVINEGIMSDSAINYLLLWYSYRILETSWSGFCTDKAFFNVWWIPRWQGCHIKPFNRQIIQFEFSPTWSCVSLTRSTTSSEWKLFIFDKIEVNSFKIMLIDVTFYLYHI